MAHKILITGASGFVGLNLKEYLRTDSEYELAFYNREVLNQDSITIADDIEAVIHLAGKAHDLKSVPDPAEYYAVNTEITKRLYDAFLMSKAKNFIFISSVKASADSVTEVLTEEHAANPGTVYGKSKLMAERYIEQQPSPDEKSYFILRPCMIHGPNNKGNLNLLYKVVRTGLPYPLGAFENKRSFLTVYNLCFVIQHFLLARDIPSGVYHVSDDEALSTTEVVSILGTSMNRKVRVWNISKPLLYTLARLGDKLHLPLTTERLNKLTESYIVNNDKLRSVLRQPLPLTARQGLSITAQSFSNPHNNSI